LSVIEIVLVVATILTLSALARPVSAWLQAPFAVVLAVFGIAISLAAAAVERYASANQVVGGDAASRLAVYLQDIPVSSDAFFYALLPILLFQGAVGIDVRHLARDSFAIFLLAILAVLFSVGLIGGALYMVSGQPLLICLLVGSIVATTDPSAVIAIFRDLGVPARLTRLVEGESLLNDATAIAVYSTLLAAWVAGEDASWGHAAAEIGYGVAGGSALGILAGIVATRVLERLRDFRSSQVTLILALPYLVFIGSEAVEHASGVVAAVAAGITLSAIGRSRLTREDFRFLREMLEQVADWATGLIFVLAALMIPRMLSTFAPQDLSLIAVTILAALTARSIMLLIFAPFFARIRLMREIDSKMNIALIWGGLRGAMTLALVLAVYENPFVPPDATNFIAITASGYTLFTLIIQGSTLRPLARALELDRLPPVERAFRTHVLNDTIEQTKAGLVSFTARADIAPETVEAVIALYQERLTDASDPGAFERVPDRDKVVLGLRAMINQERNLLLDGRLRSGLPSGMVDRHLFTLDTMRDDAQAMGRVGYLRAWRRAYAGGAGLALANMASRRLGIRRPLAGILSRRFHYQLIDRVLVLQLRWFADNHLGRIFERRVVDILEEILRRRLDELERDIDVVRLQYPDFAQALEQSVIESIAFHEEIRQIDGMVEAGIVGPEIGRSLVGEAKAIHAARSRIGRIDIMLPKPELLRSLRAFESLPDKELKDAAKLMKPVVFGPGAQIYARGATVDSIYFIANGAVEVRRGDDVTRLGRGQAFGQHRVLNPALLPAEAVSLTHTQCFRMSVRDFRALVRDAPSWSATMTSSEVSAVPRGPARNEG